jgi:pyrimidine-nucleoside phosphorylase
MVTPSARAPTAEEQQLYQAAEAAMERAYIPYSRFAVGAALETTATRRAGRGPVTAANIENGSYGLTICAERSVVVKAIADGACPEAVGLSRTPLGLPPGELPELARASCIEAIAVATSHTVRTGSPCGACRQVLGEFATARMTLTMRLEGQVQSVAFEDLVPALFSL